MKTTTQTPTAPAPTLAAHTPGPWRVTEYGGEIAIHAEDNTKIALPEKWFASDRAEAEANAALIAASPCLLAALERLANIADEGAVMRHETGKPAWSFIDEVKQSARAVIAIATGGAK